MIKCLVRNKYLKSPCLENFVEFKMTENKFDSINKKIEKKLF